MIAGLDIELILSFLFKKVIMCEIADIRLFSPLRMSLSRGLSY